GIKAGAQNTYLGGLLYCKNCGAKYTKQANYRKRPGAEPILWYMCHSRCKKVKKMIKDPNCKNKNWKMNELDNLVFNEIKKLAMDPEYFNTLKDKSFEDSDNSNKVVLLKDEIKKIDEQISRFMDLYGIGKFTIDQVSGKIDPLNEQKNKLEKELKKLTVDTAELTHDETIQIVKEFDEILASGDFDRIRLMIETLIYYIEIDNEKIMIHWKFI
ncbi:MAG: hypothetical protein E7395_01615, partial [Ruminococcaceae bacterium]|nr:hypothetical protein [Oscillospiraceae bacterium]